MRDAALLDMSTPDLRKLCKALQLPSSGTKSDVLSTLHQHYRLPEAPSVDGCVVVDAPTPASSSAEESDIEDEIEEPPNQESGGMSQTTPSPPCTPPEPPATTATPTQHTRRPDTVQQAYWDTVLADGMDGLNILDPEMYEDLSSMFRAHLVVVIAPPEAPLSPLPRSTASPATAAKMPTATTTLDLEGWHAEPPIKKPMQPLVVAKPSPPPETITARRSSTRLNVAQPKPKKQSKRSLAVAAQEAQRPAADVKRKRGRPRKDPSATPQKRARKTPSALPPVGLPPAPALGTLTPAWRTFFRKLASLE
ncbi:hypothetical protein, variant [Saprolegnia diclina VS20]|uniref:SAP domain-containing protein n=1 Tax=Saprolegnia diclina (strain VS20) TaxID=1156394 RepID=T0S904_SAPDV|nr:hypothetical protein, variant [Saprolegnia diclina VS20]EQC39142.1 hypothetical protein, variant [Saprolegnia diclina VS20]|eukprot:XP_008607203.1 hypothetical protein, variant [Saprolegnia diclina VS20]